MKTEHDICAAIAGQGRLYLGAMNDAVFVIDKPPSPAGTDVGPHARPGQPNCITATWPVPQDVVARIVAEHNAQVSEPRS